MICGLPQFRAREKLESVKQSFFIPRKSRYDILLLGNLGNFSQIVNQNLEPEIVFIDYYHMLYDRNQNETILASKDERQRTHYNSRDLNLMSPCSLHNCRYCMLTSGWDKCSGLLYVFSLVNTRSAVRTIGTIASHTASTILASKYIRTSASVANCLPRMEGTRSL